MKEARYLIVSGKVQGVGFRYLTQMTAIECDIMGWVKNEANGSVSIHAEGTKENIEVFCEKLKKGNHFARVQAIREQETAVEQFSSFRIRY